MVEESGVMNLAQIYSVVKYKRDKHQGFSQTVLGYLRSQSFMHNKTIQVIVTREIVTQKYILGSHRHDSN